MLPQGAPTRLTKLVLTTFAVALLAPLLMAPGCGQQVIHVNPGDSIQDAVDAANPGDKIIVHAGTYTGTAGDDSVVDIQTSNLTIQGSQDAVIDATGFEYGIMVGADVPITMAGCPPITVTDFQLKGLTIQDADETAVRLVGVDGFELKGGRYIDNFEYGPFPVCSKNGLIKGNFVSGSNDAAIYVGDDQNVDVIDNFVTDSVAGIEIENTFDSVVKDNVLTGNTGGILAFVLPGLPQPFTEAVLIKDNQIFDNNRANTGGGAVGLVPEGTGILVIGADNVTVQDNEITGNDSFGIAIIGNPFIFSDPRIEPFVDGLVVADNNIVGNGENPDPLRALTPGADIVFIPDVLDLTTGMLILPDPDPSDNCFMNNTFDVDFPPGIVGAFACP